MTSGDDLQQRFDSASAFIELGPASPENIKQRARRRTNNRRVMAAVASVLFVGGLGVLATPYLNRDSADTLVSVEPADTDIDTAELVTEADFTYLGAFRLPAGDVGMSRFDYGGSAATFWAEGDPTGVDDYPGSLFVSGHPTINPSVAEVSIPAPQLHNGSTEDLAIAEVLQPFGDITDGRGFTYVASTEVGGNGLPEGFRYSGLEVIEVDDEPRLTWTIWQWQNTGNDVPGHGHSSLDLANPNPVGPWSLGELSGRATAGYVFSVPPDFASESLDGNRLVAGLQDNSAGGDTSYGPPFFAFAAPVAAEPDANVNVVPLANYEDEDNALEDFTSVDTAEGAEWIRTSSGASAVITVGLKGLGEVTNGGPGPDDCGITSGAHAGPYEPQVLFYNPDDLARLAVGELDPWQLEPYRRWNPSEHLIETCDWRLSSASFDEASGLLYVVQVEADTSQGDFSLTPVVHVFQL